MYAYTKNSTNSYNNQIALDTSQNKTGINITNEILEFEILDSFDLHLEYLHDLTYGDGYLWIITSGDWVYDTIFKINPIANILRR